MGTNKELCGKHFSSEIATRATSFSARSGSTLIEVLIAGVLVVIAAMAVFPVFYQASKISANSSFRNLCMKAVQEKLAYYQAGSTLTAGLPGSGTSLDAARTSTAGPTFLGFHGEINQPGGSKTFSNSAFSFASYIYNARGAASDSAAPDCIADAARAALGAAARPATFNPTPMFLGTREAFGSHATPETAAGRTPGPAESKNCSDKPLLCGTMTSSCPCSADRSYQALVGPGFEMYVNIQRVQLLAKPDFGADCPSEGKAVWAAQGVNSNSFVNHYDFLGTTDAIKITATAVFNFNASDARTELFGVKASDYLASDFHCSASVVLKPPRSLGRYIITTYHPPENDALATELGGPTKTACAATPNLCQGAILEAVTGRPVFQNFWDRDNHAIMVAPNNRGLYLFTGNTISHWGDESSQQVNNRTCIGSPAICAKDGNPSGSPVIGAGLDFVPNVPKPYIGFGVSFEHLVGGPNKCSANDLCFRAKEFFGVSLDPMTQYPVIDYYQNPVADDTFHTDITASITRIMPSTPSPPPLPFAMPFSTATSSATPTPIVGWFINTQGTQSYMLINGGRGIAALPGSTVAKFKYNILPFEDFYFDHAYSPALGALPERDAMGPDIPPPAMSP